MSSLIEKYGRGIVFGAIGLIAAVLILTIGFGATILLVVLAALGYLIGSYLDKNSKTHQTVQNFVSRIRS